MTQAIWKFPFKIQDTVIIDMPQGALVLTVQLQYGQPCIWAQVNPDSPKTPRFFRVYGTGHTMSGEISVYRGTFQLAGGSLIFHIYEQVA